MLLIIYLSIIITCFIFFLISLEFLIILSTIRIFFKSTKFSKFYFKLIILYLNMYLYKYKYTHILFIKNQKR